MALLLCFGCMFLLLDADSQEEKLALKKTGLLAVSSTKMPLAVGLL